MPRVIHRNRARSIKNKAVVNEHRTYEQLSHMLADALATIEAQRTQLAAARTEIDLLRQGPQCTRTTKPVGSVLHPSPSLRMWRGGKDTKRAIIAVTMPSLRHHARSARSAGKRTVLLHCQTDTSPCRSLATRIMPSQEAVGCA